MRRVSRAIPVALVLLVLAGPALAGLPGDVNADCDVDIADAVLLERALAGFVTLTDEQADSADLPPIGGSEKDGSIDIGDLLTIKRIVAGEADPETPLATPVITSVTGTNPVRVQGGGAPANATIRLYVNGDRHPYAITADANGDFDFDGTNGFRQLPLVDGVNQIKAVAISTDSQSCSSAPVAIDFDPPALANDPPDPIQANTVWTPGSFGGQPVRIPVEGFSVPSGTALFIQPGVVLEFTGGQFVTSDKLDVRGHLQIRGTPQAKVQLRSVGGVCDSSSRWDGISIRSASTPRHLIRHVVIDCVRSGITNPATWPGNLWFEFSEVKRWIGSAISLGNTAVATILDSKFTSGAGTTGIASSSVNDVSILRNGIRGATNAVTLSGTPGSGKLTTVQGNDIRGGSVAGIKISATSSVEAFVIQENTITQNCNGVVNSGPATIAFDSNNVYDNAACDCSPSFEDARCNNYTTYTANCPSNPQAHPVVDNWWGSTDAALIASALNGYCGQTDPVQFIPYLNAPFEQGGVSVGGENVLQGDVYDGMPNPPIGDEWLVLDTATVPTGETFTIPDGKTLKFSEGVQLVVEGTLIVEDDDPAEVLFTSLPLSGETPASGDWDGIRLQAGGDATIAGAVIEYAGPAIEVSGLGSSLDLSSSLVWKFQSAGIRIQDDAAAYIHDNRNAGGTLGILAPWSTWGIQIKDIDAGGVDVLIDNNEIRGGSRAIDIENASPELHGNLIRSSGGTAIWIAGTGSPLISSQTSPTAIPGNEITGSCRGIYLDAAGTQPTPIVRENKIHNNKTCNTIPPTGYNYQIVSYGSGPVAALDAENNWWGGAPSTANQIGKDIRDRTDSYVPTTLPTVDFVPFYTTSDMNVLEGETYLLGPVSSDPGDPEDVLASGSYDVVGALFVPPTGIWRIGPGVTLNFTDRGYRIFVEGELEIAGTPSSAAVLQPASGVVDWGGILASGPNAAVDIQFATIQGANTAVRVEDTDRPVSITDSTIQDSDIWLEDVKPAGGASIARTTILQGTAGTSITVKDSTVVIADNNLIQGGGVGISVSGSSNATIGTLATNPNVIEDFWSTGIVFTNVPGGSIVNNIIENDPAQTPMKGTGIALVSSSPTVQSNSLQYLDIGIHVSGDSQPVIGGSSGAPHNTIANNRIGILLEGTKNGNPDGSDQPLPEIRRNNIHTNDDLNLQVTKYPPSVQVVIDAQENWWGSTSVDQIRSAIGMDADNPVAVDFSGFLEAADATTPYGGTDLFSTLLSQVTQDSFVLTPTLPGSSPFGVDFELLATADTLAFQIYQELDDARTTLVFEDSLENVLPGPVHFEWNGTDSEGLLTGTVGLTAPDEAYIYRIEAVAGGKTFISDPPRPPSGQGQASPQKNFASTFNIFENDYPKTVFKMHAAAGRTKLSMLATPQGPVLQTIVPYTAFAKDTVHHFLFDGRDASGVLRNDLAESRYFYVSTPLPMKPNHVVVENTAPSVRSPSFDLSATPPVIEVKSDPFFVIHSFEQVTTIAYELDQDAKVTLKILKPGYGDPGDPNSVVDTIVGGVTQSAGSYSYSWTGHAASDAHDMLATSDGVYTFSIEAENPTQAHLSSIYRGVIQVRQ
jgi:hypothetical protein